MDLLVYEFWFLSPKYPGFDPAASNVRGLPVRLVSGYLLECYHSPKRQNRSQTLGSSYLQDQLGSNDIGYSRSIALFENNI